jgi:glutamyl-tRNA synthetase
VAFTDRLHGPQEGVVDDFVIQRNDGVPAYNLAVVVDDAVQGVEEVVRGDDLLDSTPRQLFLARLLALPAPQYAHVPLVLGPDGARLAKRHGGVTLRDVPAARARAWMAETLGFDLAPETFAPGLLPREPTIWRG